MKFHYLKIEGSDLEVTMGFRHSGIFNRNDLFARQKDFLSSDDIGNGALFTCAGFSLALIWHKTSVFVFDSHRRDRNGRHVFNGQSAFLNQNFVQ